MSESMKLGKKTKKVLGPTKFWVKNLGPKKYFKYFWAYKILGHKKFWA